MVMPRRPTREKLEEQNRRWDRILDELCDWSLFWPP